jgi:hypothetical protein
MDDEDVGGAWIALLVAGIINTLYGIGYFIWSLIPLLLGGTIALSRLKQIMSGNADFGAVLISVIGILTPFLQVIAYFVIGIMGLISIFGAIRLKSVSSKGVVMLGIACAIGAPIIGFLFTSLSICNVGGGCCLFGFLAGNIGTIPAFVGGMIGGGWALMTIQDPDIAAAFEA